MNGLPAVAVSDLSLIGPRARTYEISSYRNPPRGLLTLVAIWRFLPLFPLVAALWSPPANSYLACWPEQELYPLLKVTVGFYALLSVT